MNKYDEAIKILAERFGCDSLISVATMDAGRPPVRTVDGYYETGAFYSIIYKLSNNNETNQKQSRGHRMRGMFTAHGTGENLGCVRDEQNTAVMAKLREVFAA